MSGVSKEKTAWIARVLGVEAGPGGGSPVSTSGGAAGRGGGGLAVGDRDGGSTDRRLAVGVAGEHDEECRRSASMG